MPKPSYHHLLAFDCVVLVDCHLSPSAVRRLYALLDSHVELEVSTAVIALRRGWRRTSWLRSRPTRRRMEEGRVTWLDPDQPAHAHLALVLSPDLASFGRHRPLRLASDHVVIWPIEAALGHGDADPSALAEQGERIRTLLKAPVSWAARSEIERRFLSERMTSLPVREEVWWPAFAEATVAAEPEAAAEMRASNRLVGRHWNREDLGEVARAEWQESCYEPWGTGLTLALRGQTDFLRNLPPAAAGQTVRCEDERRRKLNDFLAELDLFVALGDNQEPARIDEEILEAMARGIPVIAPPLTSARFDRCLPSAEACFLGDLAERLLIDDDAWTKARSEQASLFEDRHSTAAYGRRLAALLDLDRTDCRAPLLWSGQTRRSGRVLFLSDDSPYFEHLPRQLAIARHLEAPLKPYFLTMARDAALVEQMGFPVEFQLAHSSRTYCAIFDRADEQRRGLTQGQSIAVDRTDLWNHHLDRHLRELIAFGDVKALVFDGMFPFAGLGEVCRKHPLLPLVWIRRGLWQAGADEAALERSGFFDLIIEPGEAAASFDHGPTRQRRGETLATGPIGLGHVNSVTRARFELGIEAEEVAVFLQPTLPGDHRNGEAISVLTAELAKGGCSFWTADLIPGASPPSWPVDARRLDGLSASWLHAAFDIMIAGADYRSVQDAVASRKPAVFVPDNGKPTDDQMTRAVAASSAGWAIKLARGDVYGARAAARQLLDPRARAMMTELCEPAGTEDGAETAALAIGQLVHSLDLNAPPAWRRPAG